MNPEEILHLLEAVRRGEVEPRVAAERLDSRPAADLGFATVDLHRRERCGFPEVIFCQGKTPEWVEGVAKKLNSAGQDCLATRLDKEQIAHMRERFPGAEVNELARTFWLPISSERPPTQGTVLVLTAGTSDLPVAEETAVTARAMGANSEVIADVGVAGIHRVLAHRERLAGADAIVVCAGMDGALPSVVGGLVDRPVIAVPTSVGYGAAFGGVAALLTMLNSCSAGVVTVNIDAGFKAGYVGALIARHAKPREQV